MHLINEGNKKPIVISSIAIPGYESKDLAEMMKDISYTPNLSKANLIIISIGGNDLNRLEYTDEPTMNISFKEALNNYTRI